MRPIMSLLLDLREIERKAESCRSRKNAELRLQSQIGPGTVAMAIARPQRRRSQRFAETQA